MSNIAPLNIGTGSRINVTYASPSSKGGEATDTDVIADGFKTIGDQLYLSYVTEAYTEVGKGTKATKKLESRQQTLMPVNKISYITVNLPITDADETDETESTPA